MVLHKALCAEYEAAIDIAFTETVRKSCGLMDAEFQSLTPTPSSHAQWKVRAAAIYGSAEQSVSLWTLNPDDVETLLQPIRIHGDMLAKDLVRTCDQILIYIASPSRYVFSCRDKESQPQRAIGRQRQRLSGEGERQP